MNRIVNAVKLDALAGRSNLKLAAPLFLVALLIGTLVKMPAFTIVLTVVLSVFVVGGVFSVHERSHTERLYGILPLRRSEVVWARYAYALVVSLISTVLAALLGVLAATIGGVTMSQLGPNRGSLTGAAAAPGVAGVVLWAAVGLAFLYFCFSVAVAFPIYFRFGFAKAYIYTMLPLYLVVLATLLVTRYLNPTISVGAVLDFLVANTYLLPLGSLVVGLGFLAISAVISRRIYEHKELM